MEDCSTAWDGKVCFVFDKDCTYFVIEELIGAGVMKNKDVTSYIDKLRQLYPDWKHYPDVARKFWEQNDSE